METVAQHRARIRSEMSSGVREIFDNLWKHAKDPEPDALKTAAEIIAQITALRDEQDAEANARAALDDRRQIAKNEYIEAHIRDISAQERVQIAFAFYASDEPESLLVMAPGEILALQPAMGGAF